MIGDFRRMVVEFGGACGGVQEVPSGVRAIGVA
jgi:hypothetical protein